jgi:hypothetical protein
MGIRISKDIGYYLPKKIAKSILKKNYRDILEELDYEDNKRASFKEDVMRLMKNHDKLSDAHDAEKESRMFYYSIHNAEYDWNPVDLIQTVFNCDDEHGVIFKTPELVKKSHFDDDIDYYEADGIIKFKVKLLNRPIYPCSGFIFKGTDNQKIVDYFKRFEDKQTLKQGVVIEGNQINSLLYVLNQKSFEGATFYKKLKETKAFHPNVEPLAWIIAKASGILLDSVSEIQFRTTVEPAIITTWG